MPAVLAKGKVCSFEGEGKPLPDRPKEAYVDAGEAAGYRRMAEAGDPPINH